uniref:Uncharacterized protein n=1 Tax=Arundo donax TaxID=35708 RepID=A0A0A9H0W4_ARUDO
MPVFTEKVSPRAEIFRSKYALV